MSNAGDCEKLNPQTEFLVRNSTERVRFMAIAEHERCLDSVSLEDYIGIANVALVGCGIRWPEYCKERGYDQNREDYFWAFAKRRIKGEFIDSFRRGIPLFRTRPGEFCRDSSLNTIIDGSVDSPEPFRAMLIWSPEDPVDVKAELALLYAGVAAMIAKLSFETQVILSLRYLKRLDLQEIAAVLEIRNSRVISLHRKAVNMVRDLSMKFMEEK